MLCRSVSRFPALLLGLLLCAACPAAAQSSTFDPGLAQSLQNRLDQLRSTLNLKGISATVMVPGQGTWNGVTGVSHGAVPIDTAMVFSIGSATKNLVAATVLLLQEDSLLQLNDPLYYHLPAYTNIDSNITIRQLLQHRSGLYNMTDHPGWQSAINNNPNYIWQADSVLKTFVLAPYFNPGTSYRYSNTNFLLLGQIIEAVTDSTVTQVVRHRLLNKHGLSSFFMRPYETPTGTYPHNWSDPSLTGQNPSDISSFPLTAVFSSTTAAGALACTAHDLARWTQLLFSGQVLKPASMAEMVQFMPATGGLTGYGLGLMRYSLQGKISWGHGGNIAGFASCFVFSPSDSIVISVVVNQDVIGRNLALSLLQTTQQFMTSRPADAPAAAVPAITCLPNPVSGTGTVRFSLAASQDVELHLRNVLGQTVAVLAQGMHSAGHHNVPVPTDHLPAGLYFCTLRTGQTTQTERWVVQH